MVHGPPAAALTARRAVVGSQRLEKAAHVELTCGGCWSAG
jgi:hypothetical protein